MNQLTVTRLPSVTRAGFLLFALFVLFAIVDFLASIVMTFESRRQSHENSMQFSQIDPHTLQDIGISESQRFIEVNQLYFEE